MRTELIITIVVAILGSTGLWTLVNNLIQSMSKKKSAEARLIMGLAYSEIINRAESYISRGYIETDEYNELNRYLYKPYAEMGGNGTAEKLMKEVKELPTHKEERNE